MDQKDKFAALTATIVLGGTLALANNIGFEGNCVIHEREPACNLVGPDPLHTHQEARYLYGTDTATFTNNSGGDPPRGNLSGTAEMRFSATGSLSAFAR